MWGRVRPFLGPDPSTFQDPSTFPRSARPKPPSHQQLPTPTPCRYPQAGLKPEGVRAILGKFGLSGHHHLVPIVKLSGGWMGRGGGVGRSGEGGRAGVCVDAYCLLWNVPSGCSGASGLGFWVERCCLALLSYSLTCFLVCVSPEPILTPHLCARPLPTTATPQRPIPASNPPQAARRRAWCLPASASPSPTSCCWTSRWGGRGACLPRAFGCLAAGLRMLCCGPLSAPSSCLCVLLLRALAQSQKKTNHLTAKTSPTPNPPKNPPNQTNHLTAHPPPKHPPTHPMNQTNHLTPPLNQFPPIPPTKPPHTHPPHSPITPTKPDKPPGHAVHRRAVRRGGGIWGRRGCHLPRRAAAVAPLR